MREFLKRAKADYLLSSVLCIVLGIIFVVWKGGVIDVIGTILSVAMIIVGIIYLGSFILSLATFGASTIVGILVLAVGIWFLIQPSLIVSLVPVILGTGRSLKNPGHSGSSEEEGRDLGAEGTGPEKPPKEFKKSF